jgi:hypothetical protein
VSPDVQQALLTFFGTVITGAVSLIALYAKQHWGVQDDATRNAAIAAYATRLAPLAIDELNVAGTMIGDATTNHPVIKSFANTLIENYPAFAKGIGLTPVTAANFVLSAVKHYVKLTPEPVQPAPEPAPAPTLTRAPVAALRNDALGIPPPAHLENHEDA